MHDVQIINPNVEEIPKDMEIYQPAMPWLTPGIYLAQRVFDNPEVRFVGERYQSDYLQIVVVLNSDPEALLDNIFSIEQKMFKKFDKLRFDVRIRVIPPSDNIELIKLSSIVHFDKNDL